MDVVKHNAVNKMIKKYEAGVEEHGGGLHTKTKDPAVWLENLQEELMDGVFYIEKMLHDMECHKVRKQYRCKDTVDLEELINDR